MFKDETGQIVPAIVDEALWDAANQVLRRRSEDVKNRRGVCNHANLLTGKLCCTHCGAAYYRRDSVDRSGHKNSKWVCSGKIKNGADSCPSFPIYEEELKPLLYEVFRETEESARRWWRNILKCISPSPTEKMLPDKSPHYRSRPIWPGKKRASSWATTPPGSSPTRTFFL